MTIPPWAGTAARVALTPWRWMRMRIIGKQRLVEEGSRAATPAIEMAKRAGPTAIMWGTDEEAAARVQEMQTEWLSERQSLLVYANSHPSEEIRKTAHEAVEAVDESFRAVIWNLHSRRDAQSLDSYNAAKAAQEAAISITERLMEAIRK